MKKGKKKANYTCNMTLIKPCKIEFDGNGRIHADNYIYLEETSKDGTVNKVIVLITLDDAVYIARNLGNVQEFILEGQSYVIRPAKIEGFAELLNLVFDSVNELGFGIDFPYVDPSVLNVITPEAS